VEERLAILDRHLSRFYVQSWTAFESRELVDKWNTELAIELANDALKRLAGSNSVSELASKFVSNHLKSLIMDWISGYRLPTNSSGQRSMDTISQISRYIRDSLVGLVMLDSKSSSFQSSIHNLTHDVVGIALESPRGIAFLCYLF
jgi:hypothetical protein